MFTESDVTSGAAVAVLGTAASEQLFGPGAEPVGQTFNVRGRSYSVVGVTESRIEDHAESIFVPYTAIQQALGIKHLANRHDCGRDRGRDRTHCRRRDEVAPRAPSDRQGRRL